jgi:hypothetical protein
MIFVAETEERALYVFPSEAEAIANCEGLDVDAALWLFWDDSGQPLEPHFSVPNKRGLFTVTNGAYTLVPAARDHHAPLGEALDEILYFGSMPPFNSEAGVRNYLASSTNALKGQLRD